MQRLLVPVLLLIAIGFTSCKIQPVVPTRVTDVQFGKIDFFKGAIVMNMGLEINNPNKFAITVHGMELNVAIDSVSIGAVTVTDKIRIEKDTQMVYRVNMNANITDVIRGIPVIMNAIAKKQATAEVTGFVTVGAFGLKKKFPVAIKQEAVQTSQKQ